MSAQSNQQGMAQNPSRRELLVSGASTAGAAALAALGSTAAVAAGKPQDHAASHHTGARSMNTVTTKDGTRIYYKDWGTGRPVVFSHGWPLNADAWDAQMLFLVQHGFRASSA